MTQTFNKSSENNQSPSLSPIVCKTKAYLTKLRKRESEEELSQDDLKKDLPTNRRYSASKLLTTTVKELRKSKQLFKPFSFA